MSEGSINPARPSDPRQATVDAFRLREVTPVFDEVTP